MLKLIFQRASLFHLYYLADTTSGAVTGLFRQGCKSPVTYPDTLSLSFLVIENSLWLYKLLCLLCAQQHSILHVLVDLLLIATFEIPLLPHCANLQEGVYRLYTNAVSLHIRVLVIWRFEDPWAF